jgi:hypothetical protein
MFQITMFDLLSGVCIEGRVSTVSTVTIVSLFYNNKKMEFINLTNTKINKYIINKIYKNISY